MTTTMMTERQVVEEEECSRASSGVHGGEWNGQDEPRSPSPSFVL
jgi:hypothetical protein